MTKKLLPALAFSLVVFTLAAQPAAAQPGEYKAVVQHLKSNYHAKKVNIPFMWLARFAVSVVRPAGVKSFSVTLFQDLQFSRETLDAEMQATMRSSFGPEWSPILRVRSHDGQQAYMYIREVGKNLKIALVTIDKQNAAVIRATFSPDRLAQFINNPEIFGISLNDNREQKTESDPNENITTDKKVVN